jgi:hypothetical protein
LVGEQRRVHGLVALADAVDHPREPELPRITSQTTDQRSDGPRERAERDEARTPCAVGEHAERNRGYEDEHAADAVQETEDGIGDAKGSLYVGAQDLKRDAVELVDEVQAEEHSRNRPTTGGKDLRKGEVGALSQGAVDERRLRKGRGCAAGDEQRGSERRGVVAVVGNDLTHPATRSAMSATTNPTASKPTMSPVRKTDARDPLTAAPCRG